MNRSRYLWLCVIAIISSGLWAFFSINGESRAEPITLSFLSRTNTPAGQIAYFVVSNNNSASPMMVVGDLERLENSETSIRPTLVYAELLDGHSSDIFDVPLPPESVLRLTVSYLPEQKGGIDKLASFVKECFHRIGWDNAAAKVPPKRAKSGSTSIVFSSYPTAEELPQSWPENQ